MIFYMKLIVIDKWDREAIAKYVVGTLRDIRSVPLSAIIDKVKEVSKIRGYKFNNKDINSMVQIVLDKTSSKVTK